MHEQPPAEGDRSSKKKLFSSHREADGTRYAAPVKHELDGGGGPLFEYDSETGEGAVWLGPDYVDHLIVRNGRVYSESGSELSPREVYDNTGTNVAEILATLESIEDRREERIA